MKAKYYEEKVLAIHAKVNEEIMDILKKYGLKSFSMRVDSKGYAPQDDKYDEDNADDIRIYVDCYDRNGYGNNNTWLTEVRIDNLPLRGEEIAYKAEDENGYEYDSFYGDPNPTLGTKIEVLGYLQTVIPKYVRKTHNTKD